MIHAINHRKAKLSAFQGAGRRVPLEDIVTSTVFGTLNFLREEERTLAIGQLLQELGVAMRWSGPVHVVLWPKKEVKRPGFRSNYVEPDVELGDGSSRTLIIEVKWGAPLSDRELSSQWLSLGDKARQSAMHLLLSLEPGAYRQSIDRCARHIRRETNEAWRFESRSWRDVAEACRTIGANAGLDSGLRAWAQQVQLFLKREDPFAFCGWDRLALGELAASRWTYSPQWFSQLGSVGELEWRQV